MKTFLMLAAIAVINLSYAQTIYVSPAGDDGNSGNLESPVRTFQKGADLAKQNGVSVVEFEGGEYIFSSTVVLDATYSGIAFRAKNGETAVFSSLVQITDFTQYDNNIMRAPLPAGINHVRYLQDLSENWLERSATDIFSTTEEAGGEDNGCIECNNYTESTQEDMSNIRYPNSFDTPNWGMAAQYDLRANTLPWGLDILPISSVDEVQSRIFTSVPGLYDLRVDGSGEITPKAWVLNSIDGINEPGEWASIDGEIYLYPSSGIDDIYVPRLTELIRIDAGGDGNTWDGDPVRNITFDGITFTGGDFRIMDSEDITAQHDWMVVDQPDGLLRIRNAESVTIQNCTFTKSGGTGIRVDRFGQNHKINSNNLSYLGRGGINIAGRGPGYGDVSRNNEISYNHLEYIGMEAWASVAIMLDNSSNNHVHHNYIANTYFTGMAVVGPRQLMFAAWVEGADDFYIGREFHFYEIEPSIVDFMNANGGVLEGSREAMQFVYNYDNLIEENAFIDVCTGQEMFINGAFYISGSQKAPDGEPVKTNTVNRNYFYDSFDHSYNDYVIYSDSDQEDLTLTGNMVLGVKNAGNDPEPLPIISADIMWAEGEFMAAGTLRINAHVTENSTFCSDECDHIITQNPASVIEIGTVIDGIGADPGLINQYQRMLLVICSPTDTWPQIASMPGIDIMQNRLVQIINGLGGEVLECGSDIPLSIDKSFVTNSIKIFPNPTANRITLNPSSNIEAFLFDNSGRYIKSYVNPESIDLSKLKNGIYFLQVYHHSGELLQIEKIVRK
ncbi:MAG: right-handed parallel beta-helix repeat-containing protein [Bacteroidota bacterium]